MRFDIMTLFPDAVDAFLSESIIGRARESGKIEILCHNIRDYAENKHNRVDDTPYGGGRGMLMAAPPIYRCYQAIVSSQPENIRRRVIYLSPQGTVFHQKKAEQLAEYDALVLLCGHYEGVDERIIEEIVDEQISVGDYVLTGGELPACILVDCIARLKDGVLSDPECHEIESISSGMLEYPQYTRPYEFLSRKVPNILLSGDHAKVDAWRREQALLKTAALRPDLLGEDQTQK